MLFRLSDISVTQCRLFIFSTHQFVYCILHYFVTIFASGGLGYFNLIKLTLLLAGNHNFKQN